MKLHSVIDIITNSSTEIFIVKNHTLEEVNDLLFVSGRPCTDCPYKSQNNYDGPMISSKQFTQDDMDNCKRWNEFPDFSVGDIEVSYDINTVDYEQLEGKLAEAFGKENVIV